MTATLNVNGAELEVDADPDMPLLWAIRDVLHMTGTKFGCGRRSAAPARSISTAQPVRSCQTAVERCRRGPTITTIEGINGKVAETVQAVWAEMDVPQCGYCQSGQIMSAVALLTETPKPTDDDIDAAMTRQSLPLCHLSPHPRRDSRSRPPSGGLNHVPEDFQDQFARQPIVKLHRRAAVSCSAPWRLLPGFAVGYRPTAAPARRTRRRRRGSPFQPYVAITPMGPVTIISSQFEMGQGSYYGIATLVIEELGADWAVDGVGGWGWQ